MCFSRCIFVLVTTGVLCASTALAQEAAPNPPSPAPPADTNTSSNVAPAPATRIPAIDSDPYIIEDGGFSIEPIYWFNRQQPRLHGGNSAAAVGDFDWSGPSEFSYGGEVSVPAGPQNSLRFSYFRVIGASSQTLTQDETYFSEAYDTGDYLVTGYRLQDFKLSWDYLSYNWEKGPGKLRLKTLYELQYLTISSNFDAPLKAVTTDSSGNTDYNTASGSKNLIWPTFGLELEQKLNGHLRWEAKASAFAFPHRAVLWDASAAIGYRVNAFELLLGGRAFHFKDSPSGDAYFVDTLDGAYVGLRYYWGGLEKH